MGQKVNPVGLRLGINRDEIPDTCKGSVRSDCERPR